MKLLNVHINSGSGCRSLFLFLLLPLILISTAAEGQKKFHHKLRSPNLIIEGRVYYGWTLDHHIEMTPYKRHYPAFECTLMKATYGKSRWEYMYNYPFIGVSYWYSDMGNTKVMGAVHAVFPFINFPLLGKKTFRVFFRLGVGIGYLTKPYDRYDNYQNLAIGSHINGAVNLLFEGRWRIGDKFMASLGLSWMHFSNGSIKSPNYGLNMPGINVAVAYRLSKENPYLRKKLLPELIPFEFDGKKVIQLDVNAGFGVKDMQSVLGVGNRYFVATIFTNILKPISYKSRLGLGFDISYDGSDVKILEQHGVYPDHNIDVVKTGLTVAYELDFSKMAIMLNAGSYLSGMDKSDGYVYEKLALKFGITEQLFASITLKAHYARADFIAFGVGYKFNLIYY